MTLPTTPTTQAGARPHTLAWVLAMTIVAMAVVLALSATFDSAGATPVYEIVPDPAGLMIPF